MNVDLSFSFMTAYDLHGPHFIVSVSCSHAVLVLVPIPLSLGLVSVSVHSGLGHDLVSVEVVFTTAPINIL